MENARGLRTRLCPDCKEITTHRTLYVKAGWGGRQRWLQVFWACEKCGSLNHIMLPCYRLETVSRLLPSALALATGVAKALEEGPLDLDELIMRLRKMEMPGVRHVFNSDVAMVLEFLKGRGDIAEEERDRSAIVLGMLRDRATESTRAGPCPAEHSESERKAVVKVYAQKWSAVQGNRLVRVGLLCLNCQYHEIQA